MTHGEIQEKKRTYDEQFMDQCRDLAALGLQPSQIAERLGLQGTDRMQFLFDCTNKVHPLHELIFTAYQHSEDDIDAALITMAVSGDPDALELAFKVRAAREYDELRHNLFGI